MQLAGRSTGTRSPAVAGRFYPGTAQALAAELDGLLAEVPTQPGEPVPKMLLAPHAGYVYSGAIAARAYARLKPARGRIRRVVMLGPTHRVALRGIAVPEATAFATPLGAVPIDREALAAIAGLPQVVASDLVHAEEHALEVQLPFLQQVLDDFTLLPLAVGRADPLDVAEVIERLWGGDETLVVISSDLSHYLPYAEACARDRATVDRVLALDTRLDHEQACGATPLAGALTVARRRGLVPRLLDLRNSGDTAGDRRRVVGYAAVAFEALAHPATADDEAASGAHGAPGAQGAALGAALLARARNAIAAGLGLATAPEPEHPA
ncbi:MAG: AmmeMemoRadiSam system protein B, partial [Rubrivivax sp.]|nr:AmmeMemoRadiSam system protein B [Rubrivivax sp.]